MKKKLALDTLAIQAAEDPQDNDCLAIRLPLNMSTSYLVPGFDADTIDSMFLGSDRPRYHNYTRWSNPTLRAFEDRVAEMEGAEAGLAFAGGMAAISALALTLLSKGDHFIYSDMCYVGALELFGQHLSRWGIEMSRVNTSDAQQVQAAVRPNTKLIYVETPANPIIRLTDIARMAEIAHQAGAVLAVDSTFCGPTIQRPLELGADYVIHAATKYLCGHGDALGGVIVGRKHDLHKIRQDALVHLGGAMSPFNAWLILRGMMTLPVRMQRHSQNALQIARFLEAHPAVRRVIYPGLESHPHHELAKRQMHTGFGGMLSFSLKDGIGAAVSFCEKVNVFAFATSLGHLRSMVYFYPTDVYLNIPPALSAVQRDEIVDWMGKDGVIRTNVGLEDVNDLIADLDQALKGRSLKSRLAPLAYRVYMSQLQQSAEKDKKSEELPELTPQPSDASS